MHYEINVSKDGHHVFATHPRSVTTGAEAVRLHILFKQAFPVAGGYKVDVTRVETASHSVTPGDLPLSARDVVWLGKEVGPLLSAEPHLHEDPVAPKRVVTDVKDMTPAEREAVDHSPYAGYGVKVVDSVVVPLSSEERAKRWVHEVQLPSGMVVRTIQGDDPNGCE